MIWVRMLAYMTGTVDQELLLRNEYLAAENRILRAHIAASCILRSLPLARSNQRQVVVIRCRKRYVG